MEQIFKSLAIWSGSIVIVRWTVAINNSSRLDQDPGAGYKPPRSGSAAGYLQFAETSLVTFSLSCETTKCSVTFPLYLGIWDLTTCNPLHTLSYLILSVLAAMHMWRMSGVDKKAVSEVWSEAQSHAISWRSSVMVTSSLHPPSSSLWSSFWAACDGA